MSGRGGVHMLPNGTKKWDGIVPQEAEAPSGSVLRWTANNTWEDAREPLHWDIDVGKACGIGPGLLFAACLLRTGAAHRIGLVPCAVGGTEMDRWLPGADLYEQMVRRTESALRAAPGVAALRALLWYQGESDADTEERADELPGKFASMVAALRARLGAPQLPVLQVAVTCHNMTVSPLAERVRVGQLSARLPALSTVDAEGLQLAADGLHLTTAAQVELGTRLANAATVLGASRG
ncbi:hypothetical protein WJX81_004549 [Elliptochloris bilobata]|uniref:Sialate O-acetylesterase domain-containing protein n=1 Tax=Elliptochloris bilobata TaxID=381761 RepID=A0AAW1RWG0_9CHLO